MDKIELFNIAPNGMKTEYLILTKFLNIDGSDFDYKVEYIDTFEENHTTLVGTFSLNLGYIVFAETKGIGIPAGAIKLLTQWIEDNLEDL